VTLKVFASLMGGAAVIVTRTVWDGCVREWQLSASIRKCRSSNQPRLQQVRRVETERECVVGTSASVAELVMTSVVPAWMVRSAIAAASAGGE